MSGRDQSRSEADHEQLVFGRLRVWRVDEILKVPPREYLVKGLMSPGEMSIVVGQPKCGKSFLMLHIAYAIAQGRRVCGRRVKPAPVLYVAAEGAPGMANRVLALRNTFGEAKDFHVIAQPVNLLDNGDLQNLLAAANGVRAKLIIIDTLSRALAGGDENSSKDMGTFIANIGTLRAETGAHVTIVHHGTKAHGNIPRSNDGSAARGHGSLAGAADAVIEVTKAKDNVRSMTVNMAKDDPDGVTMSFKLQVVDLGKDHDYESITTCLIEELGLPTKAVSPDLAPAEAAILRLTRALIEQQGQPLPPDANFPIDRRGVPYPAWRQACRDNNLSKSTVKKNRQRIVSELCKKLLQKGAVASNEGWVWLP